MQVESLSGSAEQAASTCVHVLCAHQDGLYLTEVMSGSSGILVCRGIL